MIPNRRTVSLLLSMSLALPSGLARGEVVPSPVPSPQNSATGVVAPPPAQRAKSRYRLEENEIPKRPTAPPKLGRDVPTQSFRCQRAYVYRGHEFNCDSNVHQDAEHLRPIVKDVPEALNELNLYQKNKRSIRVLAYVGTIGLLVII